MDVELVIDLGELRRAVDIAFDGLESESGSSVKLPKDFYWSIPPEERFNAYEQPATMTIGQLSELLVHVSALGSDPERVLRQHLVWFGELMKAIGEIGAE